MSIHSPWQVLLRLPRMGASRRDPQTSQERIVCKHAFHVQLEFWLQEAARRMYLQQRLVDSCLINSSKHSWPSEIYTFTHLNPTAQSTPMCLFDIINHFFGCDT